MGIEYAVIAARRLRLTTLGRLLTSEVFLIFQHLDHFDHRLWVIAAARQILGTQTIGLQLHVAAIATHEGTAQGTGQVGRCTDPGADGQRLTQNTPGARLTLLLHAVPRGDMADLVTQYRRQLGFRIEIGE